MAAARFLSCYLSGPIPIGIENIFVKKKLNKTHWLTQFINGLAMHQWLLTLLGFGCALPLPPPPPPPPHIDWNVTAPLFKLSNICIGGSCPGQRNQQRPVPVPVTGVRYNSLLWMCTLNNLTWPDLYRRGKIVLEMD